jgi:predicted amidophosphoribosyltransferase
VVDDVVTTGETLGAVQAALRDAGAAEVRGAALARAGRELA